MIPMPVSGRMKICSPSCFSLPYIFLELSTNCNMYSMCTTCDDLLRQYHLFTVLHFCRESENFAGGSLAHDFSYHHFNSNPTANFRSYKGNIKQLFIYMYKYSRLLYPMEVLPIYQKIDVFFLQYYTIICIKNSQSPKSAMPTKIICPARISAMLLKEDGQEHPL